MNDKQNLTHASFFPDESLVAKIPESTKDSITTDSVCEVKFCTGGRLSAPPILHFYDYNMAASQKIAELPASEDKHYVVAQILNSMVVEDFDCRLLHIEEIKEVLLNIHAKWWGPTLEGFRYFVNLDEPDPDKFVSPENISTASLPISALRIIPLADGIQEPIHIPSRGITLHMIYPRAQNIQVTKDYLDTKFAVEEQKFSQIKQDLAFNARMSDPKAFRPIDLLLEREYEDYVNLRNEERILVNRAQSLCGVDDRIFATLEERIEELRTNKMISVIHWDMYNKFLDGKGKFGLQDKVDFYSEVLDQKVTRPFQFFTYNLIPSVDGARNESDAITFG